MLLDIVIDIVKYGMISLILLGLLIWLIVFRVRKARSFRVNFIDGKYAPMMGKKYLYINPTTGMIECCDNCAESMRFDTFGEAQVVYEAFHHQRKKKQSKLPREKALSCD